MRPRMAATSRLSHDGGFLDLSVSCTILQYSLRMPRGVNVTTSPSLRWAEGTSSLRPFTAMMAVADDLARLAAGVGEADAVDDVIETRLEESDEVLAGDAGTAESFLVVADELLFEDTVGHAGALLLAKLQAAVADLAAAGRPAGRAGWDADRSCTWA